MPKPRIPSPSRSQGDVTTPRRQKSRGSRSLCSPALSTASGRLTSIIDQFKDKNMESFALSPLNGRSVLNDNTDIEEPRRKTWWRKLNETSQDVELLEDNANNIIEELFDIEVLSQEKKNYAIDLPESSDNETIHSIVLPQRRLFTQNDNQPQKKFCRFVGLAKRHKTNTTNLDETINVGARELFQNTKRSKPIFTADLLNISRNKTTAEKTKENIVPEPQVRNIFGNRPANKRKNIFVDFIVSESEDEIPDIQPKVFRFQKKLEQRRFSSVSQGRDTSPMSSITTDMELDEWKFLPSSTMVENEQDVMVAPYTPIQRARLSKLSEVKESEAGTNTIQTNTTIDKTKQSTKSVSSKNKSKSSQEVKEKTLENSRITRSITKNTSKRDDNTFNQDNKRNKSHSKIADKNNHLDGSPSKPEDTDKQNTTMNTKLNKSKTRNSSKFIENEIVVDNVAANAVNNETGVINKSTAKKLSLSVVTNKSRNEVNIEIDENYDMGTNTRAQDKLNQIASEIVDQNDQGDDENNFTLEYENDDNEIVEEAAVRIDQHKTEKEINEEEGQSHINEEATHKDDSEADTDESIANEEVDDDQLTNESLAVENVSQENDYQEATHEDVGEADANESIASEEVDDDEEMNEIQENDYEEASDEVESEADANESIASEKVDDDQQTNDSDEADKAIASGTEMSEQDEMEVDDDENEDADNDESELNQDESLEIQNEDQNEIEPSAEEIEESPNITHDTTGRNRNKEHSIKSPEVIRKDETNQWDSFAAHGRNTSVRKSLAPPREITGFSDGTKNSSAEGSGWDSHRTTRKTLRQTLGKDFNPRKSLRSLVMEKSAKRRTEEIPQANSTEFPEDSNRDVEDIPESDHEISRNTRQTTLEIFQKIKQQNREMNLKIEKEERDRLEAPSRFADLFKVPNKPAPRRPKPTQKKPRKKVTSDICLSAEMIEDMNYKPPKRFRPRNASWITKRLYKSLENKLEPKYDYKARIRAEKLVEMIYDFTKVVRRQKVAPPNAVEDLKHELARLKIVKTHHEFYLFFHEFMPREIRIKVNPDIINQIPLPRTGIFSEILMENTV